MPIGLPADWIARMNSAGVDVLVHVEIDLTGSTTFEAVSGGRPVGTVPSLLKRLTHVGNQVDPIHRSTKPSQISITLTDEQIVKGVNGALRQAIVDGFLKGKEIRLKWGTKQQPIADLEPLWEGRITDIIPSYGDITLKCGDIFDTSRNRTYKGSFIQRHPLSHIRDLLLLLVPPSKIDTQSFNPDDVAYVNDISHWNLSRSRGGGLDRSVQTPERILDSVNQLARFMGGSVLANEQGKIRFARYVEGSTPTRSWGVDEIIEGSVRILTSYENIANRIRVHFGWQGVGDPDSSRFQGVFTGPALPAFGAYFYSHQVEDGDSIADYGDTAAGAPLDSGVFELPLETKWLGNAEAGLLSGSQLPASGGATIKLNGATLAGFAGLRDFTGTLVPIQARINTTPPVDRPAYLMFYDQALTEFEIVKVESAYTLLLPPSASIVASLAHGRITSNPMDIDNTGKGVNNIEATILAGGRAQFDTVERLWDSDLANFIVVDVTMIVAWIDSLVRRNSRATPVLELKTRGGEFDTTISDTVTLAHDVWVREGLARLVNVEHFEILGKQFDALANEITWRVGWARSVPALSLAFATDDEPETVRRQIYAFGGTLAPIQPAICEADDFEVVAVSLGVSLDFTIAAGCIQDFSQGIRKAKLEAITATASRDTYVAIDLGSSLITLHEVANGATPPTPGKLDMRLAKVISDGSSVIEITDWRNTGWARDADLPAVALDTASKFGRSLCLNSGFEAATRGIGGTPPDCWDIGGPGAPVWGVDVLEDTADQRSGRRSVVFASATPLTTEIHTQLFPVEEGDTFAFEAVSKPDNAFGIVIGIEWFDGSKVTLGSSVSLTNQTPGVYRRLGDRGTAPANARYARGFVRKGTSAAYEARVDSADFRRVVDGYELGDLTLTPLAFGDVTMDDLDVDGRILVLGGAPTVASADCAIHLVGSLPDDATICLDFTATGGDRWELASGNLAEHGVTDGSLRIMNADSGTFGLVLDPLGRVGVGADEPFQDIAGGGFDLTGRGVHVRAVGQGRVIVEGATFAQVLMVDLGGGVGDKVLALTLNTGILEFESLDDAGVGRVANILTLDMGNGHIGFGAVASASNDWLFFRDQNSAADLIVQNIGTGGSALAQIATLADGGAQLQMVSYGTGVGGTLGGVALADATFLQSNAASSLYLRAASGSLFLGSDGAASPTVTLHTSQRVGIGRGAGDPFAMLGITSPVGGLVVLSLQQLQSAGLLAEYSGTAGTGRGVGGPTVSTTVGGPWVISGALKIMVNGVTKYQRFYDA